VFRKSEFPYSAMRVPLTLVIPLCLAVVGGVWWLGTRHHDFLTPPTDSMLKMTRVKVALATPPADQAGETVSQPAGTDEPIEPLAEVPPVTPLKPADSTVPSLDSYRERAADGAGSLLELATGLEARGAIQRALLAAERVIDSTPADHSQTLAAVEIVRRLKPTLPERNAEASAALAVTLRAGTGKTTATLLEPLLQELASELGRASSGILRVTSVVNAGRDIPEDVGPPPVALWLAGPAADSRSTEVLSFTAVSSETLREDLGNTLLQLLRGYVERTASLRIPENDADGTLAVDLLHHHVTRLVWHELGMRLNPPEP
jgi:hypothetical protein